jgi:hypothetical protein
MATARAPVACGTAVRSWSPPSQAHRRPLLLSRPNGTRCALNRRRSALKTHRTSNGEDELPAVEDVRSPKPWNGGVVPLFQSASMNGEFHNRDSERSDVRAHTGGNLAREDTVLAEHGIIVLQSNRQGVIEPANASAIFSTTHWYPSGRVRAIRNRPRGIQTNRKLVRSSRTQPRSRLDSRHADLMEAIPGDGFKARCRAKLGPELQILVAS